MAIVKAKPTSPGRRFVVEIVNPDLHKGAPFAGLLEKKSRTGGRNNQGRITTRHKGGGHKQISSATRTVFPLASSAWSMIRTAARTSPWCCTPMASVVTSSPPRA